MLTDDTNPDLKPDTAIVCFNRRHEPGPEPGHMGGTTMHGQSVGNPSAIRWAREKKAGKAFCGA